MKAKYIQKGDAVDFAPNIDLAAGELVRLGNLIGIVRIPIKAGTLGTLTLSGVFDIVKPTGISFAAGSNVCWNSSAGTTGHAGVVLGIAIERAGTEAEHVRVLLNSSASSSDSSGAEAEWLSL